MGKLVHGGLHDLLEAEGCGPERAEDLDEDSEAELGSALDFAVQLGASISRASTPPTFSRTIERLGASRPLRI